MGILGGAGLALRSVHAMLCAARPTQPPTSPSPPPRNQETGELKGDALVTFFKAPSVQLATTLLDGAPLRDGGKPMSVSE